MLERVRRRKRNLLFSFLALLVIIAGGIFLASRPVGELMPEALAALQSDAAVTVSRSPWLAFGPAAADVDTGLIFYPGGLVLPEAYAPLGKQLAEAGYLTVIPAMPLNLAALNPDAATAIIDAYPRIRRWVIGGHSLGGAMAARYAYNNPERVAGLVMVAAYSEAYVDLGARDLPVATVYAELDGLATVSEVEASFSRLPADALRSQIKGGNHAGFGWYGAQSGDNPATISREQQTAQLARAAIAILQRAAA